MEKWVMAVDPEIDSKILYPILEWFRDKKLLDSPNFFPPNVNRIMVLGGDGTMLGTIHYIYARHRDLNQFPFSKKIFLGINFGHVGFLMNDPDPDWKEKIVNEQYEIHQFPLLEIETEKWKDVAVNDIYFNRISGKTCKVNIKVNGTEIAERISGDGIVICTALGSTGYFVPAGGSVLHPKLEVIGFGPVVHKIPYQLTSMVFPLNSEFEITLLSPPEEVKGFYDGLEMPYFQKIKIKSSREKVRLAFWKEEDFTKRQIKKTIKA